MITEGGLEVKLRTIWTDEKAQPGKRSDMDKVRREKVKLIVTMFIMMSFLVRTPYIYITLGIRVISSHDSMISHLFPTVLQSVGGRSIPSDGYLNPWVLCYKWNHQQQYVFFSGLPKIDHDSRFPPVVKRGYEQLFLFADVFPGEKLPLVDFPHMKASQTGGAPKLSMDFSDVPSDSIHFGSISMYWTPPPPRWWRVALAPRCRKGPPFPAAAAGVAGGTGDRRRGRGRGAVARGAEGAARSSSLMGDDGEIGSWHLLAWWCFLLRISNKG